MWFGVTLHEICIVAGENIVRRQSGVSTPQSGCLSSEQLDLPILHITISVLMIYDLDSAVTQHAYG